MARDGSGAAGTSRSTSREVQRLLADALEGEDARLLALEQRLGQLQAERSRAASRPEIATTETHASGPAAEEEDPVQDLNEARRLVAESGRYLRELERSIEALEQPARPAWPEPPPPAPPPAASDGWERPTPVREGSSSQPRPSDPARHELGRVFAPSSAPAAGEPAWARAMVSAQERTLVALERLAEALGGSREAEAAALEERLAALESALSAPSTPAPAPPTPVSEPVAVPTAAAAPRPTASPRPTGAAPAGFATTSQLLRARMQAEGAPPSDAARLALSAASRRAPPQAPAPAAPAAPLERPARAELLRLAGEHQALITAQVRLLEQWLQLLEP